MFQWMTTLLAPITRPKPLGARGELLAARYLRKKGYRILMRNYRAAGGEIDIVALHETQLVFVEVKTRRSNEINEPYRQVNYHKQRNMTKAARAYLRFYKDRQPQSRFDVVSIVWPENAEPQIEHIINAFEAK